MNIVLIGFRCTGKTSIGKVLAKKLKYQYFSIDDEIRKLNNKSIEEIVDEKGWRFFRKCESEIIENLKHLDNSVIDTGGGSILTKRNRNNLKKSGIVILVHSTTKEIIRRMHEGSDRPKLKSNLNIESEIKLLLKNRNDKYLSIANIKVNTSSQSIDKCVQKILDYLKKRILSL